MEINGLSSLSNIQGINNSRASIAENFDTFLQLLTTQLQNQNPLDPLDTNQFTQQLVQFTGVEQSLKMNEQLETLLLFQSANTATAAVSYIGKTIVTDGTSAELNAGEAVWTYNLQVPGPNSTITIRNSSGQTVYTERLSLAEGAKDITWDGIGTNGITQPDGVYDISIDARDANDNELIVSTSIGGRVDSVDLSGVDPVLIVGSQRINLSTVTLISEV
ncbi:MAG: flagellar hook assembly protein FlgD [Rhizobiales bacterium]|nr:flagellar hook assembly protein FlgD [Hyphomicrobiales bacterium]